ncbi:hypothetical protein [Rheinheimera hassiensis]|nr:hypothetical protein [Rheinheimera hassiensis]
MFLAATNSCAHCKGTIYPDDEIVSSGMALYHLECAELIDLPDNSDE